jgi:hypothetical protein
MFEAAAGDFENIPQKKEGLKAVFFKNQQTNLMAQ